MINLNAKKEIVDIVGDGHCAVPDINNIHRDGTVTVPYQYSDKTNRLQSAPLKGG